MSSSFKKKNVKVRPIKYIYMNQHHLEEASFCFFFLESFSFLFSFDLHTYIHSVCGTYSNSSILLPLLNWRNILAVVTCVCFQVKKIHTQRHYLNRGLWKTIWSEWDSYWLYVCKIQMGSNQDIYKISVTCHHSLKNSTFFLVKWDQGSTCVIFYI